MGFHCIIRWEAPNSPDLRAIQACYVTVLGSTLFGPLVMADMHPRSLGTQWNSRTPYIRHTISWPNGWTTDRIVYTLHKIGCTTRCPVGCKIGCIVYTQLNDVTIRIFEPILSGGRLVFFVYLFTVQQLVACLDLVATSTFAIKMKNFGKWVTFRTREPIV